MTHLKLRWQSIVLIPMVTLLLNACMSVLIKAPASPFPISLTEHIPGYRIGPVRQHIAREIWLYQLLGVSQWSLWTREGVPPDDLIVPLLQPHVGIQQGVVRLKITHSRTALTGITSLVTLGILSPTAINIEADIVDLEPLKESELIGAPST